MLQQLSKEKVKRGNLISDQTRGLGAIDTKEDRIIEQVNKRWRRLRYILHELHYSATTE
uniref:AlNc14C114G6488 protein n=1 Tax=Albugo laibachii Nc14 TaxID=890382 RepID=F0WIV3_9STRA|nr:AlNc14C114G6488 [Albugo laibachii Nc14]|eukprot:CCA21197.1 AlNc14C114G6488 [Albugo laibachii Nc14]